MRKLPWFRVYTEARTDPVLRGLTHTEHFVWFQLLCYSAEQEVRGAIQTGNDRKLALEIGVDEATLRDCVASLAALGLITDDDGYIVFEKFAERQYGCPSDMPEATRERKRRQRERT